MDVKKMSARFLLPDASNVLHIYDARWRRLTDSGQTLLIAVPTPSLQLHQCFITCRQPAASTSTLQSSIDIVDRTAFRPRAKLLTLHPEK
jgi:hypothetical protein